MGTDQNKHLNGIGEFGYEITNPVPTSSIQAKDIYLSGLVTEFNEEIGWERVGSTSCDLFEGMIDIYTINIKKINEKIATLYIHPYNKINSTLVPKGFKLKSSCKYNLEKDNIFLTM